MAEQDAVYIGWGVYVGEGGESYHSRGCGLSSMNWHASCIPTFCRRSRVSLRDCECVCGNRGMVGGCR